MAFFLSTGLAAASFVLFAPFLSAQTPGMPNPGAPHMPIPPGAQPFPRGPVGAPNQNANMPHPMPMVPQGRPGLPGGLRPPGQQPSPQPAPSASQQVPAPGPAYVPPATPAGPPPRVDWRNGQLSLQAESYPLSRIIQHVAKITDVDVSGLDKISGSASASFSGQTLAQAFDTLLPGWDYAFTQPDSSRGLRGQLVIFSRGGAVPDVPKPKPAAAPPPPKNDDDDWGDDSPEELAAIAKLKQAAARGDQPTLRNVISTSTDSTLQENAYNLLKTLDPQAAIESLIQASSTSTNPQLAVQSLALLQRSGADPDTILGALGTAMDSSIASVKAYAVQSLPNYGQDALRYMAQAMADPDRNIRFAILQSSARFPWAQSIVQQGASDTDDQVRNLALQILRQQAQQQGQQQNQNSPDQNEQQQTDVQNPADQNQQIVQQPDQQDNTKDDASELSSDDDSNNDSNPPN